MLYESILPRVQSLPTPESPNERTVEWVDEVRTIGVARTHDRRIEIFLSGAKLEARLRTVRESLAHQTWYRGHEEPDFEAYRLILPPAGHFDQVAAFLCTELLRNGASMDMQVAFSRTEPVIDLAISRLRLTDEAFVGLVGELLLLDALLRRCPPHQAHEVVDSWAGFGMSTRDFVLGDIGVEVKTTTSTASSHQVQGVHQVEPTDHSSDGGQVESALLLVSIGISWVGAGHTGDGNEDSLPVLVNRIVAQIIDHLGEEASKPLLDSLVLHIRDYGGDSQIGYDHHTMAEEVSFSRPFQITFVRAYDMSDPSIQVLRADDVRQRPNTDLASVRFRLNLPEQVTGDLNPVVGLNRAAAALLERSGQTAEP